MFVVHSSLIVSVYARSSFNRLRCMSQRQGESCLIWSGYDNRSCRSRALLGVHAGGSCLKTVFDVVRDDTEMIDETLCTAALRSLAPRGDCQLSCQLLTAVSSSPLFAPWAVPLAVPLSSPRLSPCRSPTVHQQLPLGTPKGGYLNL